MLPGRFMLRDIMLLQNAIYYDEHFDPVRGDILVQGERIAQLGVCAPSADVLDCSGCTIVPGFIDIHIHGFAGGDPADASASSLDRMSRALARHGVTSFCPTGMTLPEDALAAQFRAVESCKGKETGARILGVRMEGPYLSQEKKGAQRGDCIRPADEAEFRRLCRESPVRIVDVAPETEGAIAFAQAVCADCVVSIAHTAADFETTQQALRCGFTHATHLFNAMPPIRNRDPGAVTAVFDSETATAEMICDGFHNHPAVVRMACRILGEDRFVVVSDAMRVADCGDGDFVLGGQQVFVRNGQARLADGTIAASTTNVYDEFRNLLRWGVPMRAALKACTINPARVVRADREIGTIETGKFADLLVLDANLDLCTVIIRGKRIATDRNS